MAVYSADRVKILLLGEVNGRMTAELASDSEPLMQFVAMTESYQSKCFETCGCSQDTI